MSRQFNISPELLCDQHLLGEHSEQHEIVGLITSDHAKENPDLVRAQLRGQVRAGNVDLSWVNARHDALVDEAATRGWEWEYDLEFENPYDFGEGGDIVDSDESRGTLMRCDDCRPRIIARFAQCNGLDMTETDPTAWRRDGMEVLFDAEST